MNPSPNDLGDSKKINRPKKLIPELSTSSSDLSDRRGSKRILPPNPIHIRIQIGSSQWENARLGDVSLSGLSFWYRTENKIDLKAVIRAEVHFEKTILYKGMVRPIWVARDIEGRQRYGTSFIEIENYQELLKALTEWNQNNNLTSDRRRKSRRRNQTNTAQDVLKTRSARKINRRVENRINKTTGDRRVVVVGLGIAAPNGLGIENFLEAIRNGIPGVNKVGLFQTDDFPCHLGGEIQDYPTILNQNPKAAKRMERSTLLSMFATNDALQSSAIDISKFNKYRTSTIMGSTVGGLGLAIEQAEKFRKDGYRVMHPYGIAAASPNACSSEITAKYRLKGPSFTFSQGCTSAASAVAQGYDLIKSGKIDCAIVGGTDAPLIPSLFGAYCRSGLLAIGTGEKTNEPKPYDPLATGTILSEGAACLILEELESALASGHTIFAEIGGYSSLTDGHSMMSHEPTGIERERAMRFALDEAQISKQSISLIFGHGIGVYFNDYAEYSALKRLFGKNLSSIPLANIKSMIGYAQGACAAIESVAACLAIRHGFIPPVINTEKPFEGLNVSSICRKSDSIENVLVNTFGFGGKNVCIVFKNFTHNIY